MPVNTPPVAGEPELCKPTLEMPSPADTAFGRSLSNIDLGRGLRATCPLSGVEGDSVPIRDFRAADRGVMLPPKEGVAWLPAVRLLVADSMCRPRFAGMDGDALFELRLLGVKGLLDCRKAELRLGVRGLADVPFLCLSMGMLCSEDFLATRDCACGPRITAWLERRYRLNDHGERPILD